MTLTHLPTFDEMYAALLRRDQAFDGVFIIGVRSTGIFCRPTCPARKPKKENVEFFRTIRDAVFAGYRPCLRCRPVERSGAPPAKIESLIQLIETEPGKRWTNTRIQSLGLDAAKLRRWFQSNYGMTFLDYHRARRLGLAIELLKQGESLATATFDTGYQSESGFREAMQQLTCRSIEELRGANQLIVDRVTTPLGPMVAGAMSGRLCLLEFADRRMLPTQFKRLGRRFDCVITPGRDSVIAQVQAELDEYFGKTRTSFDVPVCLAGTPFQESVWQQLTEIPFGQSCSYEELANRIGNPTAMRAVGRANGDNRMSIVVPCHRVIGADGKLRGYGGGLWRKQYLLDLEQAVVGRTR